MGIISITFYDLSTEFNTFQCYNYKPYAGQKILEAAQIVKIPNNGNVGFRGNNGHSYIIQ